MKKLLIILFALPFIASAAFDHDLYYGLRSEAQVSELQEFLTEQGVYTGPITGNFFSLTLKAVKDFQTAKGISPISGYFGPLTRAEANKLLSDLTDESGTVVSPATTSPATTDTLVAKLNEQIALLLAQVEELKKNQAALGAIQAQVAEQQQTLTQIQANTTPAPAPAPVIVTNPPVSKRFHISLPGECGYHQTLGTLCGISIWYFENNERKIAPITLSVDDPEGKVTGPDVSNGTDGKPQIGFTYFPSGKVGLEPFTFCSNTSDPTCVGFRIKRTITVATDGLTSTKALDARYSISQ
ncbi:MAG: peptidoglycan-binding protein [Candidatus Sungbacteria bacterium]|nr:peptidoglycan-binding protein [Candidatus Sungbacteria bacterium]